MKIFLITISTLCLSSCNELAAGIVADPIANILQNMMRGATPASNGNYSSGTNTCGACGGSGGHPPYVCPNCNGRGTL